MNDLSITVDKTPLKTTLMTLARVCPRGAGTVHVAAWNDHLTLTAQNNGIAMKAVLVAVVETPGLCVLPIREVIDAVGKTRKSVTIQVNGNQKQAQIGEMTVQTSPLDEFRPTPQPGPKHWEAPAIELQDAITHVSYAAAPTWDIRPGRRAVWFTQVTHPKTGFPALLASACDEWRSATHEIPGFLIGPAGDPEPVGIPVEAAEIVAKTFTARMVDMYADAHIVAFGQGDLTITMPRQQPIPMYQPSADEGCVEVDADRLQLLEVAREAAELAGKSLLPITITVFPDSTQMLVRMRGSQVERVPNDSKRGYETVTTPVARTHHVLCRTKKGGMLHINPAFLADALARMDDPSVRLRRVNDVLEIGDAPTIHAIALMRETDEHSHSDDAPEAA